MLTRDLMLTMLLLRNLDFAALPGARVRSVRTAISAASILMLGAFAASVSSPAFSADQKTEEKSAAARMGTSPIEMVDTGAPADLLVLHKIRTQQDQPGNLAFVDLATGNVVARVPVGREPHEVAVSDDRKWALVTNTGANSNPGNTLSLISLATRKEVRRVDLGAITSPHGVWFQGGLFYFTGEGAKVVGAYDPERDKVSWVLGTGQDTTHNLVVSKSGNAIYTANRGSDTVSIMQQGGDAGHASGWHVTTVPVCKSPQGLDLSPDGLELWVGCRGTAEIAVINTAEKKVSATFPTGVEQIARIRFTPDGSLVLAAGIAKGEITIWNAKSRSEIKRIKLGSYAEGILITPDGKRALIGVTTDDLIAEIDLVTMTVTRRLMTGRGPDGMAWIGQVPK